MKISKFIRRFLIPSYVITLYYFLKFRCFISNKAEVELSSNLKIGSKTIIGSFTKIKASDGPLIIGRNVQIADGCNIFAGEKGTYIGDDCMIGAHTVIISNNYRYNRMGIPIRKQGLTYKGIHIEENVWLGAGVCVTDGARICSGSIIAPNSVVTSEISRNSIAQGNPAKIIFKRR